MSEEPKRSLVGVTPPAKSMPSADDRKTNASPPSISSTSGSRKVIIKSADMKDEMQSEAVNIAISAFENLSVEKDVAEQIKKEFDKKHGPTWHCIVGKNFVTQIYSSRLKSPGKFFATPLPFIYPCVLHIRNSKHLVPESWWMFIGSVPYK